MVKHNLRRIKYGVLGFITFLLILGCCEEEVVNSDRLSSFEKTLMPNTSPQELTYIDNEGNTIKANDVPKESTIERRRHGPESCAIREYEEEEKFLIFPSEDIFIEFELRASDITRFSIFVNSETANTHGRFDLSCTDYRLSIEEQLKDVSINGFDFKNVLVFQNCSESSQIQRLIYSPVNGVEYLEFRNGDWLRLKE